MRYMFNLLITSDEDGWKQGSYEFSRDRVIIEYTAPEIVERYRELNRENIEELKSFPCIFMVENEPVPSRIGFITNVRIRAKTCVIEFEIDDSFPELPQGTINGLRNYIELGEWELSRTHWAVKDEPILSILLNKKLISQKDIDGSYFSESKKIPQNQPAPSSSASGFNHQQVFIVHGHDEVTRLNVESFLKSLNIEPIVLSQQPSSGKTIIEKIEHYSNVGFGIVLYTECDVGSKKGALVSKYRARQNVVFEHGFLIGKLTRQRVAALVKGDVETPNDISGVVYINIEDTQRWKEELRKEMRVVGYEV